MSSKPLIIGVLSPSNRPAKIARQRIAAFSAGTREFWGVDPEMRTIEVSLPGSPSVTYDQAASVRVTELPVADFPVRLLFE